MSDNKFPTWLKISTDVMPMTIDKIKELNPYRPKCDKYTLYKFTASDILPDFADILEYAGLEIKHMQIFYRPGNSGDMNAFIHTDGHEFIPDLAKINFVFSEPGNIMKWWLPKANVTEKNRYKTEIGSNYLRFESHECTLIDEKDLIGLYVVNAGIPHSVDMSRASILTPRICVSITPVVKNSGRLIAGCQDVASRIEYAIKKLNLGSNNEISLQN
jgi:hypothetical protein